jgi:hypothetical protein
VRGAVAAEHGLKVRKLVSWVQVKGAVGTVSLLLFHKLPAMLVPQLIEITRELNIDTQKKSKAAL